MTTGLTAEVLLKYLINCSKLGGILKNPEKKMRIPLKCCKFLNKQGKMKTGSGMLVMSHGLESGYLAG